MFCENCGTQIPDDSAFCPNCGAKFEAPSAPPTPYPQPQMQTQPQPQAQPVYPGAPAKAVKQKKPINVKLLVLIAVLIVAVVAGVIVLLTLTGKVDSAQFFNDPELEFVGYNGYGTIDEDSLEDVYDFTALQNEIGSFKDGDDVEDVLTDGKSIKISCKPEKKLKNGDEVTVTVKINYDRINRHEPEKKLVGEDTLTKKVKVEGLKEIAKVDPFKVIKSVTYDSTTSYSDIAIEYDTSYSEKVGDFSVSYYDYYSPLEISSSKEGSFSVSFNTEMVGDNVKVTIDREAEEFVENGFVFTETSKEYTPETISYLDASDEINESDLEKIKEAVNEKLEGYYGSSDSYTYKVNKTYYCFGTNYDSEDNQICISYSYTYTWYDGEKTTYYAYCYVSDVKISSSGSLIGLDDMYVSYSSSYDSEKELSKDLKANWTTVHEDK